MKAAVIRAFGDPSVLTIADVVTPTPRPGHVLVKILAAGVNRFDHYIREGSVVAELAFPHILGADAAGEIAELGAGVEILRVGDRVIPMTGYPDDAGDADIHPNSAAPSFGVSGLSRPGSYAQYQEVPARWVVKDETGLPPEHVATLPMAALTAVRAMKVVGETKPGDHVLITAGSSGAGTFTVQVAKALGARVAVTTRSDQKADALRTLGADLVINATDENLADRIQTWTDGKGVDVAVEFVGGPLFSRVLDATRPQGIVVPVGFIGGTNVTFDIRNFFFGQKQIRGALAGDIEDLRWALEQVKAGRLRPTLDRTLPLQDVAEAHRLVAGNQLTGSVSLLPWAA